MTEQIEQQDLEEKFIFTIEISTDDLNFCIPLNGCGIKADTEFPYKSIHNAPYNWNINWGDGIIEEYSGISSAENIEGIQHIFSSNGFLSRKKWGLS